MENKNAKILAIQTDFFQSEIELPLTTEEKRELQESEFRIEKAKELIEKAHLVIAQELSKIRTKKLYRATHKTFAEYIIERFGLTREYGQEYAQIGDFINAAGETLQLTTEIGKKLSRNSISEMAVGINRLGKSLGLKNSEFNTLKPIIKNSINLMIESVPKSKDGISPDLVPRTIEQFYKVLNEFVQESIIEIDGKSIAVTEAKEKNLLNQTSDEEVISQIAKHILENSEVIGLRTNYKKEISNLRAKQKKILLQNGEVLNY